MHILRCCFQVHSFSPISARRKTLTGNIKMNNNTFKIKSSFQFAMKTVEQMSLKPISFFCSFLRINIVSISSEIRRCTVALPEQAPSCALPSLPPTCSREHWIWSWNSKCIQSVIKDTRSKKLHCSSNSATYVKGRHTKHSFDREMEWRSAMKSWLSLQRCCTPTRGRFFWAYSPFVIPSFFLTAWHGKFNGEQFSFEMR